MKAPAFWYAPVDITARMLSPLSWLYRAGGCVRCLCAKPYRAKIPVICVGNVTAGGSGKTPTALAIAVLLKEHKQHPAFVTRGYGGSEHGPLRVDLSLHTAAEVGDEALLLARIAPTWIGRDRVAAIREAEKSASHIILDDGLQNPNLLPDIALLVVDAAAGFGNGQIIPAGPLREPLKSALKRVRAAIVIGEDSASVCQKVDSVEIIRAHLQPVFSTDFPRSERFVAFAGIGRPEKFYALCRTAGLTIIGTHDFPDHHRFNLSELDVLVEEAKNKNAHLLTTEKDAARLPKNFQTMIRTLPVQLVFDDPAVLTRLSVSRSAE